jgi:methylenetetrahydrofolate--tRNA-(uracil-5-)-methyltransferase
MEITVIGGGLAGVEAAYQAARLGASVVLCEMRPGKGTPAHKTSYLSELVCSNSLKSQEVMNAHGLLKEELRLLGSLILRIADTAAIPGGKALVVDRELFAREVTAEIQGHPRINVIREEVTAIPAGTVIIATGPLTSDALSGHIKDVTGEGNLYFYDAISPIIDAATIDMTKAFFGSRYAPGSDDYLNCPMTEKEYNLFYRELKDALTVDLRSFEDLRYFEGCLPIEVMAGRGASTLLFGPMKPVGMVDPATGVRPHAVVQLRREDESGNMYNMVGFQTKLTYPEQERVFRLIPALAGAVFLRHGSIHRNTYLNSPGILTELLRLKKDERVLFAGQITGAEGYMESAATGLLAGISGYCQLRGKALAPVPANTCLGALTRYLTTPRKDFQPMNINFGLFQDYHKKEKARITSDALASISLWGEDAFNQGDNRKEAT